MKQTRRLLQTLFLLAALAAGMSACEDDVENLYSGFHARFSFPYVQNVAPLMRALGNPGIYCLISVESDHYAFHGNDGSEASWPRSQIDMNAPPVFLNGFIVGYTGKQSMSGHWERRAYDSVCPTCYRKSLLRRRLQFQDHSFVHCSRCNSTYDLDTGYLQETTAENPAKHLERYRLTYEDGATALIIQN